MANQNQNYSEFHDEYIPSVIKIGRFTNLLGVAMAFLPVLVLTFIYKLYPNPSWLISGFILIASAEGVFWVVEPLSYYSSLGLPGTYMSFLSGNISNLRLPVSIASQKAAGVESGSEQGMVVSTIGIGVSVILNIIVLTIGVILGSSILSIVPDSVVTALNNIVPALFGALLAQQVIETPKLGITGIILAGAMILLGYLGFLSWVPGDYSYVVMIVAIFGTILIGRAISGKEVSEEE